MSEKISSFYRYKQASKRDGWSTWYHTYADPLSAAKRVCYHTYTQAVNDAITIEVKTPDDSGEFTHRTFVWELALREV